MLEYLRAVPSLWIPDNLKARSRRRVATSRRRPRPTRTGATLRRRQFYPRGLIKPKDKAAVEMSVLVVQRWILARLRNRQFFSLRRTQRRDRASCCRSQSAGRSRSCPAVAPGVRIDRPAGDEAAAADPLRVRRVAQSQSRHRLPRRGGPALLQRAAPAGGRARHGAHDRLRRSNASSRAGASPRTCAATCKGKHTTLPEHMPAAHRRHMQWTPGRLLNWGQNIGAGTRAVVQWQLENRPHPEQGYRACLGLLNLCQDLRRGAPGGGVSSGAHHRIAHPQTHPGDPEGQSRPAPGPLPRGRHGGRNGLARARQRARRRVLP